MEDKRMARKDLESIKFEKGDLVRPVGSESPALGIVLGQRGVRIIVKWVSHDRRLSQTRTLAYALEKVGEEGAK